jgi:hypothetical protein
MALEFMGIGVPDHRLNLAANPIDELSAAFAGVNACPHWQHSSRSLSSCLAESGQIRPQISR